MMCDTYLVIEKDVCQFEIPVRNPPLVTIVHSRENLVEDVAGLVFGHGLVFAHRLNLLRDVMKQVPSLGKLHHDAEMRVFCVCVC